jgi:CTP synthase
MQCSVVEWASNIAHLERPNSSEFDPDTPNPVISLLPEQQDVVDLGGTMRLGLYPCRLKEGTLARQLYDQEVIYERHRHRYEFNNAYRTLFAESGYVVSGTSPDGRLVEMIELPDHPFFIASQFHPEFQSRPSVPHPLFLGFMAAAGESLPAVPPAPGNPHPRRGSGSSRGPCRVHPDAGGCARGAIAPHPTFAIPPSSLPVASSNRSRGAIASG